MTEEKQVATELTPARCKRGPGLSRARTGEPFPLVVQGGDRYESLDDAMAAGLPILGKIIADLARKEWQAESIDDGQETEGVAASLELMEDQCWKSLEVVESFHRLARTLSDQLVTGECLKLLDNLGEEIHVWVCYSDFIYRHPGEWPVYAEEREIAALERLLRREQNEGGKR